MSAFYTPPEGYTDRQPAPWHTFDAIVRWELPDGSQHSKPVTACRNMEEARQKAGLKPYGAARSVVFVKLAQVAA